MGGEYWFCVWLSAYLVFGVTLAYCASAFGPEDWAQNVLDDDFPMGMLIVIAWPMVGAGFAVYFFVLAFQRDVMRRRKIRDAQKDPAPAEEAP